MEIINPIFKEQVAIVVVGFNRLNSIKRLLNSLLLAKYPTIQVPLVISIDCSGDENLYQFVRDFKWPFGEKYVRIQTERLGLLKHIYSCGELTSFFKGIILLEDDLVVSPFFYSYVLKMLDEYGKESRIAEISLYKNEMNGYVGLPFVNIQNGYDVFLMQDVSTWGQCWTSYMWNQFTEWRDSHSETDVQNVDMPQMIKRWERAWSKYYNAYVVDTGKYVLYPNVALTTNFSDAGEHGGDNHSVVQVNLLQNDFDYRLGNFNQLAKYDIYFNNTQLVEWLGLSEDDVLLDVYGYHDLPSPKKYILTTRKLPCKVIRSYSLYMRPIELNVKNDILGDGLFLYQNSPTFVRYDEYSKSTVPYFLKGFNVGLLFRYIKKEVKNRIIQRLKFVK